MTMCEETLQPSAGRQAMGLFWVMKRKYCPCYSYLFTTFNIMQGNIIHFVV